MKFIFLGRRGLLTSIVLKSIAKNKLFPEIVIIEDDNNSIYPNLTEIVCNKYNIKYYLETEVSKS